MPSLPSSDLDLLRARLRSRDQVQDAPAAPRPGESRGVGFFEAILQETTFPLAVLCKGRHLYANQAYAALLGYRAGQFPAGVPLADHLPAEALDRVQAAFPAQGARRQAALEVQARTCQGHPLDLHLTLKPLTQGGTEYQVVTAQDLKVLRQAETAFRRNEQWWRHLFAVSMIGMAVLDPGRRILEVNDSLHRLLGRAKEELTSRLWSEVFTPVAEVPLDGEGAPLHVADLTARTGDGSTLKVRVDSNPIYHPDGAVQCYLAMVQDLTAYSALAAKEALLLRAAQHSHSSIVITAVDGAIEYVNPAFERATGYREHEVLGQNPRMLKSGKQSAEFYRELWATLLRGEDWQGRICNKRKDGSFYWEQATISPVLEDGELRHFLAVKQDVTEVLELETAQRQLAAAIEQSHDAVFLATVGGRAVYFNAAARRLFDDHHRPVALGQSVFRLLPHANRLESFRNMRRALAFGNPWEGRVAFPAGLDPAWTLEGSLSLVADPDGRESYVVGVFQDVTEALREERNVLQVEKMNTLGALASGVAHDFNNVLTAILTATELMEWELAKESPAQSRLQVIRQAALRAKDINRRIQAFTQRQDDAYLPFDLSGLVKEVCSLLRTTLPPHIILTSSVDAGIWIQGDPSQLHQVLMNLAVNAYQAMGDREGRLEISLTEDASSGGRSLGGREVILEVGDSGPGIPPEVIQHIFEPYFTTKGATGGTGVGLAVVQRIVSAHQGSIRMESTPGHGALATVILPSIPAPAEAQPDRPDRELAGVESLLLVGEDEVQLALNKQALERLGYRVRTHSDGAKAYQEVLANPNGYDVVVTEAGLKGLPGRTLVSRLRQVRRDMALVFVSDPLPGVPEDMAAIQADAFVAKPLSILDLARAIREVAPVGGIPQGQAAARATERNHAPRLLLAEDSSSTRALLKSWIEKAGCEVLEAVDGEDAWEKFSRDTGCIDLVFTDLVMPRLDGLGLIERIRAARPGLPVVVLTSLDDQESTKAALNLHVDELLNKPFTNKQLVECLERQVRRIAEERRAQESHVTARAVRQAQQALVATPEAGVPITTVHRSLTDAGGDLFKWFARPDGSLFLVLGDVMGHSVISSYAVAAFLGMLSTTAPQASSIRDLAERLNRSVKEGPFPDIPICALLGHWHPESGRLHLLNAGMPHGYLVRPATGRGRTLDLNGTPLGFFATLSVEEQVLWLREGERVLLMSDGIPETRREDGTLFESMAPTLWNTLAATPMRDALEIFCSAAHSFGQGGIQDDVLAVAFEQGPTRSRGITLHVPSTMEAVDEAVEALRGELLRAPKGVPLTRSTRFNIEVCAREALTNAVAHGNAGRPGAEVVLHANWMDHPPRLVLSVADEGKGYEPAAWSPGNDPLSERGRGMMWIQQHAASVGMVGGELTLLFAWEA